MSKSNVGRSRITPRILINGFTEVLAVIAVSLIVIIMLVIVADIARRWFSGKAIPGVVEWSEVAMATIVFLGLGFAERRRSHASMTLVVRRLPPRAAALLNAIALLLVAVVLAWMVYVTADRALESFTVQEFRFGLVRVPVWPARIAVAMGLLAYLLQMLLRILDTVRMAYRNDSNRSVHDDSDELTGLL